MHELPVTEQLLNIVLEHANQADAERVLKINVVIGDLTHFNGESIQFYLDILSKGTKAERASLLISRVPARVRCKSCGNEFTPKETDWVCPRCSGFIDEVISGRECYVESIEVE